MTEYLSTWEKKRIAWFAKHPKCKICGGGFDHYSRNMICRKCQKIMYKNRADEKAPEYRRDYVKKHRAKIQAYQKAYYLKNRDAISERKKIKYKKEKLCILDI